ncbi:MAG: cytochrome c biogenesis protein CcsA [Fimbriimonadaceae bacterium]
MKASSQIALGLAVTLMLAYNMWVPNGAGFQNPFLARIMFTHLPSALICSVLFIMSAWYGIKTVKNYNDASSVKLHASAELGLLFAALTMITGIIFSKVQWGEYWHGDPRQVSFLMVLFLYGAMIALRSAYADQIRRDRNTAWYSIGALLPGMFLTFVFPRLVPTLHPNDTIVNDKLDIYYKIGLYGSVLILSFVVAAVFKLRVKTELQARKLENHGNNQTRSGDPTSSGVVRPVALSPNDHQAPK